MMQDPYRKSELQMSEVPTWEEFQSELDEKPENREAYEEAVTALRLGQLVRSTRESADVKQSDLAYRMGSHQSAIARLEGGGVVPSLVTLKRVADALRVSLVVGFVPARDQLSLPGPAIVSDPSAERDEIAHPGGWIAQEAHSVGFGDLIRKSIDRILARNRILTRKSEVSGRRKRDATSQV